MSYIKASTYRQISEKLGDAFAKVRDAIRHADSTDDAYTLIQDSLVLITEFPDDDVNVSATLDPKGSVMGDLGTPWYTAANTGLTSDKASSVAAGLFSSAINKLNKHVRSRTYKTGTTVINKNILEWYDSYAIVSGSADDSLFSADGTTIEESYYFSDNFVDLSSELSVTIPTAYRRSTYA